MIVIFGKGEVGQGLARLLDILHKPHLLMDDQDRDDTVLQQAKTIIVSPGIPPSHIIRKTHGPVCVSELTFLGRLLPEYDRWSNIATIGITGTNGKSTTTWVMKQVLEKIKQLKENNTRHIHATGNFKPSLSATLADILETKRTNEYNTLVIECSSFMLYQLKSFTFDYGVLLNISPDHLDRHKDMQDYTHAKENMLRYATHTFRFPKTDPKVAEWIQETFVSPHNAQNISAVYAVLMAYTKTHHISLSPGEQQQIFSHLEPLAHRCQDLGLIQGIRVIDDGICTSSLALQKALESMTSNVILIIGGYDKGDSFDHLNRIFRTKVAGAVCVGTVMAPVFMKQFKDLKIPCVHTKNIPDTIKKSFDLAKKHEIDTILFSPGCASFDIFDNVYDRIAQFTDEIDKRKK